MASALMPGDRLLELDAELVRAAKDIHVLSRLSWPSRLREVFLDGWRRGSPRLPEVEYVPFEQAANLHTLERIARVLEDDASPAGAYLAATARSYLGVGRLIACAGQPDACVRSVEVYGRPGDKLSGSQRSSIDAARYFLEVSRQIDAAHALHDVDYCIPARNVAEQLQQEIGRVITEDRITVVVDPALASKAAAGATRVRLRDGTCFSEFDVVQLLQHEVFVHSLTALNGRRQPRLRSLSLGAPRTTGTQEGLATFAELVSGAIDIARLERIALRIVAIDAALGGADFLDVFRLFLEAGQIELESFNSAMRVFRGVPLAGGHAFTKDGVYLQGLIEVHTFFRWALRSQRLHLCEHLFAGRLTLRDVLRLEPLFADGSLAGPRYLPPWMTRTNGLTAYLAFSVFANEIAIDSVKQAEFERLGGG